MSDYKLLEVSGVARREAVIRMNAQWPDAFMPLKDHHLANGRWWLALDRDGRGDEVGFCGIVPFEPFTGFGYLKRAAVVKRAQGHGLQREMIRVREDVAEDMGFHTLVSETEIVNIPSANNFIRCGYHLFAPERPWATDPSLYWIKRLTGGARDNDRIS